jgi:hypothetical protein
MGCDNVFMERHRSLETTLEDIRRKHRAAAAMHMPTFNQHHRQFLDRLRSTDWVRSSGLPEAPKTKLALLKNGWMERRDTLAGAEYRITKAGLAEVSLPR